MSSKRLVIVGTSTTAEHLYSFVKAHDLFDVKGFAVNRQYRNKEEYLGLPVYELENLGGGGGG
ncbi:MAG: hypothetical protein IJR85_05095 [Synergistaceae bacterium]|nr:hypothetical protein [Synergistaceae bacterium]